MGNILKTLRLAPESLLNIVSCGCKAAGCGIMSCGRRKLSLFCTSVCMKCSGETCSNVQAPTFDIDEEESALVMRNMQKTLLRFTTPV